MKIVIKNTARAAGANPAPAPQAKQEAAKSTVAPEIAAMQKQLAELTAFNSASQNRQSIQQSLHTLCKQLGVKGYEQPDVQRRVYAQIMREAKEMGGDVVFQNRAPRIVSSTDPNVQLNKDGNPMIFADFAKSALQKHKFIDAPAPSNKPAEAVVVPMGGGVQAPDPNSFSAGIQSRIAEMVSTFPAV